MQLHGFSLVGRSGGTCGEKFGKKTGEYSMGVWSGWEQVGIR
jgi:hypothetical protein